VETAIDLESKREVGKGRSRSYDLSVETAIDLESKREEDTETHLVAEYKGEVETAIDLESKREPQNSMLGWQCGSRHRSGDGYRFGEQARGFLLSNGLAVTAVETAIDLESKREQTPRKRCRTCRCSGDGYRFGEQARVRLEVERDDVWGRGDGY